MVGCVAVTAINAGADTDWASVLGHLSFGWAGLGGGADAWETIRWLLEAALCTRAVGRRQASPDDDLQPFAQHE
jgi:hypothetical protein